MTDVHRTGAWVLKALAGLLILGACFASTGFYIIDEVIYVTAADTLLSSQSLFIENGFEEFRSRDLRWIDLLVYGTEGLVPQYPVGSAVVGAGLIGVLDVRGILVFHAVCIAATVFVTRALTIQLFKDESIGLAAALLFFFGTFIGEYAFGLWPHAVSVLSTSAAFLWFLKALEAGEKAFRYALISGLILGAGLLFRLDSVLLLPVIVLLTVPLAVRPVSIILGGAMGLAPAFVIMAIANQIKFGSPNPISYGQDGGAVALNGYLVVGLGAGLVLTCLIGLRVSQARINPRLVTGIVVIVLAGTAIVLPEAQRALHRLYTGFIALFVDARTIIDPRAGVERAADGTLRFWGLPKKALGQSMPWLGLLSLLIFASWGKHRRAIQTVLVFVVIWSFPFVIRAWHGGLGLNMRYLMPTLPLLSALCVVLVWRLTENLSRPGLVLGGAAVVGIVAGILQTVLTPSGISGVHQILSTFVLFAVALTALIAGVKHFSTGPVGMLALGTTGFGLGLAIFISASDVWISQLRRMDVLADTSQGYDGPTIVYLHAFRSVLQAPNQMVAVPHWASDGPDANLVSKGLAEGYRVLMPLKMADDFVETNPDFTLGELLSEPLLMRDILQK
jgi:hypothetical protein